MDTQSITVKLSMAWWWTWLYLPSLRLFESAFPPAWMDDESLNALAEAFTNAACRAARLKVVHLR